MLVKSSSSNINFTNFIASTRNYSTTSRAVASTHNYSTTSRDHNFYE